VRGGAAASQGQTQGETQTQAQAPPLPGLLKREYAAVARPHTADPLSLRTITPPPPQGQGQQPPPPLRSGGRTPPAVKSGSKIRTPPAATAAAEGAAATAGGGSAGDWGLGMPPPPQRPGSGKRLVASGSSGRDRDGGGVDGPIRRPPPPPPPSSSQIRIDDMSPPSSGFSSPVPGPEARRPLQQPQPEASPGTASTADIPSPTSSPAGIGLSSGRGGVPLRRPTHPHPHHLRILTPPNAAHSCADGTVQATPTYFTAPLDGHPQDSPSASGGFGAF
jgi:hypothetical protein